jgi:hypothetical protein
MGILDLLARRSLDFTLNTGVEVVGWTARRTG